MKHKYLLIRYFVVMMVIGLFSSSFVSGQATLKHSYTFEDGTANDGTGNADGTLQGDATIVDGAVILTGGGFVSLPGQEINVNEYSAVSVEAVFKQGLGLDGQFSVLYCFGETTNDPGWPMGIDYLIYQPTRQDNDYSRFSVSCSDTDSPWSTESGINGKEIVDTSKHYVVTILTASEMKLYLDGALLGTTTLSEKNKIANLSNDTVLIGESVYTNDANWIGEFHEMNIFEGELDEATIVNRAEQLLGVPVANATLSDIAANKGDMNPEFDPETDIYELMVEYGTTQITINATTAIEGATVQIFDGLGNEIEDGIVNFTGDGIDMEIVVTALNGTTQESYYVSVFLYPEEETASLVDIELSAGSLLTDFDMDVLDYLASAPFGTSKVNITGVPAWTGAKVYGGGEVTLTDGYGSTTITVISEDGNTAKVYNVEIGDTKYSPDTYYYLEHEAGGLFLGAVSSQPQLMSPAEGDSTQLFAFVPGGVNGQYFIRNLKLRNLTSVAGSSWDMLMRDGLNADMDSCRFILHEFEIGRYRIETVVKDGADQRFIGTNASGAGEWIFNDKYIDNTLAIWHIIPPEEIFPPYDTYLSALSVDGLSLSPVFDPFKQNYYLTLPVGTTSLTVTAQASDVTSTVNGAGTFDVSGGEGSITLTVTASDNKYTRDYTINYQTEPTLTLKHSYTFADGTARDQVGTADGIIAGGEISEGVYTASVEGDDYIILPPEELALYTYPSITMEAYVLTGENTGWTMFAYFGGLSGANVHFLSLAGETDLSRTVINEGSGESAASGAEPATGEYHHYVSVLTNDSIKWYIDGALAASIEINGAYTIQNISTENAWLCKSGYSADPTWIGSIFEFNIYSGQMDEETVASRAYNFPQETAASDATLSDISVNGTTIDGFSPQTFSYNVVIPESTTEVPAVTAVTNNSTASRVISPATGIPGTTTIEVTSEDNSKTITYTVTFCYSLADATLSDLTIDGTTVSGFSPDKSAYFVNLPGGTTNIPAVAAVANNPQSTVKIVPATSIPGLTTITVTAVDGSTVKSYAVYYSAGNSVNDFVGNNFKVYPTIFANSFKVNTAGETCNISVYNLTGKSVLKQEAFNGELEVSVPETGMYIVKIEGRKSSGTFKVLKIK